MSEKQTESKSEEIMRILRGIEHDTKQISTIMLIFAILSALGTFTAICIVISNAINAV